ncbi:MAG: hypothetical protein AB7O38_21385 [Pirellulaceae bacterium]
MTAASASAMSDPDRDRWFRRRWIDIAKGEWGRTLQPSHEDAIEQTGHELLLLWRRRKARDEGIVR